MIRITLPQLEILAPAARDCYRQAFRDADRVLARYGVNETALRLAHFMAQVLHETGGLTVTKENLNYRAERIVEVWPRRFKNVRDARPYARNPEALANKVYGGRMGNREPGDGWKFVGRGLLQITGRSSYERYATALGIDLLGAPDLACSSEWSLPIAAEEWKASGCNAFADRDDLRRVTRAINGGTIGLDSRRQWLARAKKVWMPTSAALSKPRLRVADS